jgi:neutral ceramidase
MLKAGMGRAALRFPDGLGLFGFGPGGGRGVAVPPGADDRDQLEARALWMEQDGAPALVVSLDLVSGSRLVHAGLARALRARGVAIDDARVLVVGTHTHSGPGHFLGNLYDTFAHHPRGTRADVIATIVEAAVGAATQARDRAIACRVGVARRTLWRAGRNRSLRAFLANGDDPSAAWDDELVAGAPPRLTPEERAIDPRLTAIVFIDAERGAPVGTWATWCCHAATLPRRPLRPYHRDWPGVAVDRMDARWGTAMVHQGANGDVTSIPSGKATIERPLARVRALGLRVARAWRAAAEEAARRAVEVDLEIRHATLVPREAGLDSWEIGAPVVLGSEEALPGVVVRLLGESRTSPGRRGPQGPKRPALGPLQGLLRRVTSLAPSPDHPMWLVRLGDHVLFASPFEQTTMAARTVEKELVRTWAARRGRAITAGPLGLAGDYAGYVTTPAEYRAQHYEGGHTIYGERQLEVLTRIWCSLV